MQRQVTSKTTQSKQNISTGRRPLQKVLIGFAMMFFGASMILPFKNDNAGIWAIFKLLWSFNPFNWLFFIASFAYVRLMFRLHEIKLPIFKSLILLVIMLMAVVNLYFHHDDAKVGIGVIFWLASGYMLLAACIRWRYPTRGLKSGFGALVLFIAMSIWVQNVYRHGNASDIWRIQSQSPQQEETGEPHIGVSSDALPEMAASAASVVSVPSELNTNSLIQVERDFDLYNPWTQKGAPISCETLSKRQYPVLLPPRYLEDGYEWRNYQHGDTMCNTLLYVGTPYAGKPANIDYKIWQDRRSNIYLLMSNRQNQALFEQSFTITRDDNEIAKSDYVKKLNEGFAHLVDDDAAPLVDNEYVFTRAATPNKADNLPMGCQWKPVAGRPNTYQWGTGRINFRGQSILKPTTYCSREHVAVLHLNNDVTAQAKGIDNQLENRLHIKLFHARDLKPVDCGAVSLPFSASDVKAWQAGHLKAESVQMTPVSDKGCLNIQVKLNNGQTISNNP